MATTAQLKALVRLQKTLVPRLYGKVDFDRVPERFSTSLSERCALPSHMAPGYREQLLADKNRVERTLAFTMLGDPVADAYAALIPKYGFKRLVDMLVEACAGSVDDVKDAPEELARLIEHMEQTPDWLDKRLSARGARAGRAPMALVAPFVIRGVFIATFANKYSGMPMALTGALSNTSSVQRVKETTSFFTTATLPRALERHGPGFRAAAMVRLMHSMVRASLLMRPQQWDVGVYGIPIPQIDQMPAGMVPAFFTAQRAVKAKRGFTRRERGIIEFCRHQCFLLGLHQDLLPEKPGDVLDILMAGGATLREGYDEATNGQLVRATMAAYLPKDHSLQSQVFNSIERSSSKVFFRHAFGFTNRKVKEMGVVPNLFDYANFAIFQAVTMPRLAGHIVAEHLPIVNRIADRRLVELINQALISYGHAEYTSDPSKYQAAKAA